MHVQANIKQTTDASETMVRIYKGTRRRTPDEIFIDLCL